MLKEQNGNYNSRNEGGDVVRYSPTRPSSADLRFHENGTLGPHSPIAAILEADGHMRNTYEWGFIVNVRGALPLTKNQAAKLAKVIKDIECRKVGQCNPKHQRGNRNAQ